MNLKSRIKKIENVVTPRRSQFCRCYGVLKWEVLPFSADEWKRRFAAGEETVVKLPEICDKCLKPFDRSAIEVTFEQQYETARQRRRQAAETLALFAD